MSIPTMPLASAKSGHLGPATLLLVATFAMTAVPATAQDRDDTDRQQEESATFLDEVTVTATKTAGAVRDTPGQVSVISGEDIQDFLIEDIADLVKFEPGVYVDNDVARLGLNGFNIRGLGGNRVLTQIDGMRSAEQFDFGPFTVNQVSIDLDTLKSAEIVRSAGSALYGSDALGGVVSLLTKDPVDYLGTDQTFLGVKAGYDGRSDESSLNLTGAAQGDRTAASLFVSQANGSEIDNQGENGGLGLERDQPNPQDRDTLQLLGKVVVEVAEGNSLRAAAELSDAETDTEVFSARGVSNFGPITITTGAVNALDTQERMRLSIDQTLVDRGGMDLWTWRAYSQSTDTEQNVIENRSVAAFGPPTPSTRDGLVSFDQFSLGLLASTQKDFQVGDKGSLLWTSGVQYRLDDFDMLRDRVEFNDLTGEEIPSSLVFPTKYFPESETTQTGIYTQGELRFGRVSLIPGVRYDAFELEPNEQDQVYLLSGGLPPAGFDDDAISPKLGVALDLGRNLILTAQYAAGFRAPPYSTVNTGFTNLAGGYQTLANPDLEAETSDNFELGFRGTIGRTSWSVNGFSNRYDDFISLEVTGFNPFLNVIEFQNVNLNEVEIEGVEFRLESNLTNNLLLRVAYANIEGNDVTGDEDVPLQQVNPNEGVLGLRWFANSARWGLDGSVRFVEARSQSDVGDGQFAPDAFEVIDLVSFIRLPADLTFRIGLMNLNDATYWEWQNVRGRSITDPRIGLFTSPGRNVVATLTYAW